jgi:hypothetical protein
MGLPVPGVFLYKDEDNRHLVVDGQQRLRTLQYFYTGVFIEKVFRLVGVSPKWEGKTYSELETSDQLKLDDSVVHATIFPAGRTKGKSEELVLRLRADQLRRYPPFSTGDPQLYQRKRSTRCGSPSQ